MIIVIILLPKKSMVMIQKKNEHGFPEAKLLMKKV